MPLCPDIAQLEAQDSEGVSNVYLLLHAAMLGPSALPPINDDNVKSQSVEDLRQQPYLHSSADQLIHDCGNEFPLGVCTNEDADLQREEFLSKKGQRVSLCHASYCQLSLAAPGELDRLGPAGSEPVAVGASRGACLLHCASSSCLSYQPAGICMWSRAGMPPWTHCCILPSLSPHAAGASLS